MGGGGASQRGGVVSPSLDLTRLLLEAFFTDMLKKSKKEKFFQNFEITLTTKKVFRSLKSVFFVASVLLHFDFKRKIRVKTNASEFEIFDIISQLIEFTDQ